MLRVFKQIKPAAPKCSRVMRRGYSGRTINGHDLDVLTRTDEEDLRVDARCASQADAVQIYLYSRIQVSQWASPGSRSEPGKQTRKTSNILFTQAKTL